MVNSPWKTVLLGKVATLQRGYDLPHRQRKPGIVPIITSSGDGYTHSESRVTGPGVVTGRYGTIGEVFYVRPDFWPLNTTLYVKDFHGNDPLFVSYLLRTIDFHTHSGKSGVPGVNRNDLHEIMVQMPPTKAEQKAIAKVLNDADALMESLEQLIAKKRHLKQGTMQELLTGKKRLPGFQAKSGYMQTEVGVIPTDWDVTKLHSLVRSHNSGIYKSQELYGHGCNIVGVSDIYDIEKVEGQSFANVPLSSQERTKHTLQCNDLLYGESSLVREGIARTVYVTEQGAGTAFAWHTRRYSIDQRTLLSSYLYYYLQSRPARAHMISNSIQTAITGINTIAYFACPIIVPPRLEQTAIATVLSDLDAEISWLEAKLAKNRLLKQGMIHNLLTGMIRLV